MSDTPAPSTNRAREQPAEHPSGAHRRANIAVRYLRTAPASVALAIILLVTSAATGTMFGPATTGGDSLQWAAGVTTTVDAGFWWTPLTALFVPNDPVQVVVCVVLALTLFALAERLLGTVRACASFLVTGTIGSIIGVFLQWGVSQVWAHLLESGRFDFVLDPTVGIVGALIVASAYAPTLWRRRIRILVFAVLLMFVLYNGDSDNLYRLLSGLIGLAIGSVVAPRKVTTLHRSSHAETRNLVAVVIAVTGLGPLTALLSNGGSGPLSFISALFAIPDVHEIVERCAASTSSRCSHDLAVASAFGVGPIILSLIPLALLVIAAIGLRRGRRFAWLLAIVVNGALTLLSLLTFVFGDIVLAAGTARELAEAVAIALWVFAAAAVPIAALIVLVVTRRHFTIRAPVPAVRSFVWTTIVAFVVLAAIYLIVGALALSTYVPSASLGELLLDTVRRFEPSGFDAVPGVLVVPSGGLALAVYQWVGPIFWIVFILATLRLYRASATGRDAQQEAAFRALLKGVGGGTLGFMGTWPGNVYWFSDDGRAAVAYRVINDIAITLSDPVCAPERVDSTVREFIAYCDASSWTPVFYSVHEQVLPTFEELGWQHMSVGEETLMHPLTLDMAGKPWQKVRQALNRGIKEGVSTLWTTWDELPLSMSQQITTISEQWVSEKELPEMGFTLGGMDELKDPEVALFLAIGPDGRIQAVTSWLPSCRDGRVVGWTIDFMRRGDNSIPGIMEFVIASAALHMQKTGIEVLSLSGAPLATKPVTAGGPEPERTVMSRLLEFLAHTLEPAYGFSSLFKFKSKFNPTYATMYMAYADPVTLPAVGSAIGKAYLPDASPAEYLALARTLMTSGK